MNQETGVVTKDEQSGWQEIRQKYIRVYCEESNVETKAGRKQCEKVCEHHFCCFDVSLDGDNCQEDKSMTCDMYTACQIVMAGGLFDYVEEPAAGGGAATDVAMPGAPLLPSGMNDNYIPVPPDMIGDMPIFDNLPPPPAFGDDAKEGGVATKPKKVIEYSSEALREIQADVKQRCSDYRGGCNARRYVSPTHAASTRRRMDVRTILPCCANCVTAGGVDWGRMVLSIYIFEPGEQCLHIQ